MDGIVGGVPVSGSSGWQGGEVFSEVQRWNRIEAVSQMKTPWRNEGELWYHIASLGKRYGGMTV